MPHGHRHFNESENHPGGEWVFSQCTDAVDPTQYPAPWGTQGVEMDMAFTLHGASEPLCPDLADASGNGIPDVVDAQCPCIKRQRRSDYVACVTNAMAELVQDACATAADQSAAERAASRGSCHK
jgi:hypothetical protein